MLFVSDLPYFWALRQNLNYKENRAIESFLLGFPGGSSGFKGTLLRLTSVGFALYGVGWARGTYFEKSERADFSL